jgi:hypothetical protein
MVDLVTGEQVGQFDEIPTSSPARFNGLIREVNEAYAEIKVSE